jgi:two-component system, sensor histidine kinase RegB
MGKPSLPPAAPRIALPWIIRLRYALAMGQILVVGFVFQRIDRTLPLGWIALAPAIIILTNLWLARTSGTFGQTRIAGIFIVDALCLTEVLMLTGGPNNPFSLLYLVQITLAATILTRRQTWALGGLSTACFGALFVWHWPIAALETHTPAGGANLHLIGMWMGFAAASTLIAYFAGRIAELLREHEQSMLRVQQELASRDRLASLVTLAAGAAHELNTPLGSIAIASKELENYAAETLGDDVVLEDSRLIRTEVDRCREILQRMSTIGAEGTSGAVSEISARALLETVAKRFPGVHLKLDPSGDVILSVPRHSMDQALEAIIKNAVDASCSAADVQVALIGQGDSILFQVVDQGSGMTPETLRRVGEPFFTTKEPGRGMGLGIFLVRTLAQRLGGALELSSTAGQGTVATLSLPAEVVVAGTGAAAEVHP